MSEERNFTKCSLCNNLLSYFPIHQTLDDRMICGRCIAPRLNCVRVKSYETLAQFVKFPCRFHSEGCKEHLTPDKVPQHEADCPHRRTKCPTACFTKCQWEGSAINFNSHCEMSHMEHFLKYNSFKLDLLQSKEYHTLVKCQNDLFIVRCRFDRLSNILWCSTVFGGDFHNSRKYECQVALERDCRKLTITVPLAKNFDRDTKIDLHSLKNDVAAPTVVRIAIFDTTVPPVKHLSIDQILSELECPACRVHMKPPIFLCLTGHSICQSCQLSINSCPVCDKGVGSVQNFALQNVTNLPINRCKYRGCNVVAGHAQIANHEAFCLHSDVVDQCPMFMPQTFCFWSGPRSGVCDHLASCHRDVYSDSNLMEIEGKTCRFDSCYTFLLKYADRLFKCYLEFNKGFVSSLIDLIGPEDDRETFSYEVSIYHKNELILKDSQKRLGILDKLEIPLHLLLTLNFVSHEYISYKILITEKFIN